MSETALEKRVSFLEQRVAELTKAQLANGGRKKDSRMTAGMFTDDPEMQELFAEAMRIREADRQNA